MILEDAVPTPRELAIAGLVLLPLGLVLAHVAARWFSRWPREPREEWAAQPLDLALAPLLFLMGQLLVGTGLGALYSGESRPPVTAGLAAVPLALTPLLVLIAVRCRQAGSWRSVGLGLGGNTAHVLRAVGLWCLAVPIIVSSMLASSWIFEQLGQTWEEQSWGPALKGITGTSAVVASLLAVVVVPFCEELLFRGWLQQGFASVLGSRRAILIVAALFAIVHDRGVLLPIFALALVLGVIRERTQRLWPCVAVHMLHNGVQVALLVGELS